MRDLVKKSLLLGLGAASITKAQAEKIVRELMRKNTVTVKDGRQLLGRISRAAQQEQKRIASFAAQEARRMAKEFGAVPKAHVAKARKKLNALNKELSKRGRKVLNDAIRQLSK